MANFIIEDIKNAWNKKDNGLIKIIIINIIVFVSVSFIQVILTISGLSSFFTLLINKLMLPASLSTFILQPWSIISYFFLHMNFMHILWNMLFLYWFGKIITDNIGNNALISLYVLGGIIGGLLYMATYNIIPYYGERVSESLMLGASAGVFSVVVGSATLMPNYTFYLLLIGPVRIKYIALFYVLLSFFDVAGSNAGGEIAHLGGAFIGYIFIKQLQNGVNIGEGIINLINLFNKKKRKKESKKDVSQDLRKGSMEPSQDEVDKILDKISDSGYSSLTKKEKERLFNASKKQ
ncbi:MAG: rhomboid family intramembrane serine protease [Cytophagales bacterium]|nr:rhomboid family intramembrane serine protease [Flammeovirgaceae bacterium]PDH45881.1 MAG: rhomboid family intramembrane serine protease [Rhodothermaeota bacterium MED-G18]|tara:strand:+ start:135 stop:1013 length:879 start_codon:yes stop_codon:yes gene_type:complete